MKISALNSHLQYNRRYVNEGRVTASENKSAVSKGNHDVISFSAAAQSSAPVKASELQRIASPLAVTQQERIDRIKLEVQNGTYSVDNQLIVDAIVRRESKHD